MRAMTNRYSAGTGVYARARFACSPAVFVSPAMPATWLHVNDTKITGGSRRLGGFSP